MNGLVWVHGAAEEYDAFEALGSPGWNWKSFYAAMHKVTNHQVIFAKYV